MSQWCATYRVQGDHGLDARPNRGRPPSLTDKQLSRLKKLLAQGPRKHGYMTELWTLRRMAAVIEKHFGVTYDPSGVWHVLRRLDWSCQKPERQARERDEDAITTWRKNDWPRIKKSAAKRSKHCFSR